MGTLPPKKRPPVLPATPSAEEFSTSDNANWSSHAAVRTVRRLEASGQQKESGAEGEESPIRGGDLNGASVYDPLSA